MKIQDIDIDTLRQKCCDLLAQSYMELGQRPSEEDIVSFSVILANDLKEDFWMLYFIDVQKAFRNGIRNTKEFHITVKTYYSWVKSWRKIINENENKESNVDRRISYRSRKGTGIKRISNQIKKIGNGNN